MEEAHLWYWGLDGIDAEALARCRELLSPDERDRAGRYLVEGARNEFVAARAMLRELLGHYGARRPSEFVFRAGAHGRPEIAAPPLASPLSFNVSHCEGLVCCVVSPNAEVGVDAEFRERRIDEERVRKFVFSSEERGDFFRIWTLKEAYLKARGTGLALPMRQITMKIAPDGISASFGPGVGDEPANWRFRLFGRESGHEIALAIRVRDAGAEPEVLLKNFAEFPMCPR
jgi:4'-phosphopantetheinyl transferase